MKALFFAFVTVTLFYSAIQTDRVQFKTEIKTASVYQGDAIDVLDPSWPKLA